MSDWEVDSSFEEEFSAEEAEVVEVILLTPPKPSQTNSLVSVWTFDELDAEQQRMVHSVSDLLTVSLDEGFALLRKFRWEVNVLQERWFEQGESRLRQELHISKPWSGLIENATASEECILCLETFDRAFSTSACKSHWACRDCWIAFLDNKVTDGRASLEARCPGFKCLVPIQVSLFEQIIPSVEQTERFRRFRVNSLVDDGVNFKWCPNPAGCRLALKTTDRQSPALLARCLCGFSSCWRCASESHDPASCEESASWEKKNSSESENVTWILAHTKRCPKCSKPIEKNQGCNHMHCPSPSGGCGHHFCWICLKGWENHLGDPYSCNIYRSDVTLDAAASERSRIQAKNELGRYMHFFERYAGHEKARTIAERELVELEAKVEKIHDHFGFSVEELQFIKDAVIQIRDCRRVLKWTYVFGYYLADTALSKPLFEHLQKNLEQFTDRLHEYIEKDLDQTCLQLPTDARAEWPKDFDTMAVASRMSDFRATVVNYASVTSRFMASVLADLKSSEGLISASDSARSRN